MQKGSTLLLSFRSRLLPGGLCLFLAGCSHAPSQDILGSFFPAWMLCALGGLLFSVLVRLTLSRVGVNAFVPARLPVYGGLAIAATFFLWLLWFGN